MSSPMVGKFLLGRNLQMWVTKLTCNAQPEIKRAAGRCDDGPSTTAQAISEIYLPVQRARKAAVAAGWTFGYAWGWHCPRCSAVLPANANRRTGAKVLASLKSAGSPLTLTELD